MDYLTNDKQTHYLSRLEFENGSPVFKDYEIAILDSIKKSAQNALTVGRLLLSGFFILILLAWSGNWLSQFRHGIKRGGWLTMGLAVILNIAGMLNQINLNDYFQNADTILRLFPAQYWLNFILFMTASLIGSGFLLAISLAKIKNDPQD